MDWVNEQFPAKDQIMVFDKDDTLMSSRKEGRVLHQHLIDHVVRPINELNNCITVLYTLSSEDNLRRDLHQFLALVELFDFFITGDNFTEDLMIEFVKQDKLSGDPRELEWERIYKPVSRIFSGLKAVLLDDCAGTVWSSVTVGVDGVKAYAIEDDNVDNANHIFRQCMDMLNNNSPSVCSLIDANCKQSDCVFWVDDVTFNNSTIIKNSCGLSILETIQNNTNDLLYQDNYFLEQLSIMMMSLDDSHDEACFFELMPFFWQSQVLFWILSMGHETYWQTSKTKQQNREITYYGKKKNLTSNELLNKAHNFIAYLPIEVRRDLLNQIRVWDAEIYPIDGNIGCLQFDDIDHLNEQTILAMLRDVELNTILLALRMSTTSVQTKIFALCHPTLQDDFECMGPPRYIDVVKAQIEIVQILQRLIMHDPSKFNFNQPFKDTMTGSQSSIEKKTETENDQLFMEVFSIVFLLKQLNNNPQQPLEKICLVKGLALKQQLKKCPPKLGYYILECLPTDTIAKLMIDIARQSDANDDFSPSDPALPLQRIPELANLYQTIQRLEATECNDILQGIKIEDLPLYHSFERISWWVFEDLLFLDKTHIKIISEHCSLEKLHLAMKGASDLLVKHIDDGIDPKKLNQLRQMNQETENVNSEEIEVAIEAAQTSIVNEIIILAENNVISVNLKSHASLIKKQQNKITPPIIENEPTEMMTTESTIKKYGIEILQFINKRGIQKLLEDKNCSNCDDLSTVAYQASSTVKEIISNNINRFRRLSFQQKLDSMQSQKLNWSPNWENARKKVEKRLLKRVVQLESSGQLEINLKLNESADYGADPEWHTDRSDFNSMTISTADYINYWVDVANQNRKYGRLYLDGVFDHLKDPYSQYVFETFLNDFKKKQWRSMAKKKRRSTLIDYKRQLEIILTGVQGFQEGENPKLLLIRYNANHAGSPYKEDEILPIRIEEKRWILKNGDKIINNDDSDKYLVSMMTALSDLSRKNGLLCFENISGECPYDYLYEGLTLLTDGYDPKTVKKIMTARKKVLLDWVNVKMKLLPMICLSLHDEVSPTILKQQLGAHFN